MKQWILSVAGIVILSVVADIILPNGQTRKYIKTVVGIVITLVVVQPILNFFADDFELSSDDYTIQTQQQYLQYVSTLQATDTENLEQALEEVGFSNVAVVFDVRTQTYQVALQETFTTKLYEKAQVAVASVNSKFPVRYIWNADE